jgi:hypothetical protein
LKTDFFGRATAGGARRKGAERKTSIRLELIRNPKRGDRGVNALGAQRIYFDRNGRKARPCQNLDAFYEGARIIVDNPARIPDEVDLFIPKKKADRAWHRAMAPRSQTRARVAGQEHGRTIPLGDIAAALQKKPRRANDSR